MIHLRSEGEWHFYQCVKHRTVVLPREVPSDDTHDKGLATKTQMK